MPPDPAPRRRTAVAPRRRSRALLPTIVVLAVLLALVGILSNYYTDWLWFRSVDYTRVFATELRTRALLFVLFGLLLGGALALTFVVAYRSRPTYQPMSPEQANLDRYRTSVEPFRRGIVVGVSVVLGLLAGSSASGQWRTYLVWRNKVDFGVPDPQFSRDVAFYSFALPWYRFLLGFAFAAVVLSLLAAAVTHYLYGGLRLQSGGDRTTSAARIHFSVLLGLFVLLKAIAYWLDRYSLAIKSGSVGGRGFTGLTYTDANALLLSKATLAVISAICAVLFVVNLFRRGWLLPGLGVGLLLLSAILLGGVYPAIVQYFQVRPSEVDREEPYIAKNITATRDAYGIANAEVTSYDARTTATSGQLQGAGSTIPNVRLIDPAIVSPTFRQLQQIRGFYEFPDALDIDRYTVSGQQRDVIAAVREVDPEGQPQRNWINDHLVYTHGFGFVGAFGNTRDADGRPTFVESNIPPTGRLGQFEPRIYFGERSPAYSIVGAPTGAAPRELDYPDERSPGGQQNYTYAGRGGVPIGSLLAKTLYAVKFQESKILLAEGVNAQSKVLYIRSPRDRVEKVAPWLKLDGDPYPAIVDGRIQWILDGYTTVNGYPYSQRTALQRATADTLTDRTTAVAAQAPEEVNYIRNSVKATVDAYDGTVSLYAWDEQDPVLKTWMRAFPGTVKPRSQISPDLLAHLRYPEDLFKVQRTLLAQYHVTAPREFYGGQDFWRIPKDPTARGRDTDQPPYFLTLQMPGQDRPSFSLSTTFVPVGRENLTGFAAVNAAPGPDYGKIRVLKLPANTAISGPSQVQNSFEADTTVSSQLTLLRQGGSQVVFGNLLTLPVGGGLLYVEPVYVQASSGSSAYPLLQRVLVSFGDRIGFQPTLQEALDSVFQGSSGTSTGDQPGGGGGTGGTGGTAGSDNPDLRRALDDANKALRDAQDALRRGDFGAYGAAQTRLADALKRATAASRTSPSPSPSPSASASGAATPAPSGSAAAPGPAASPSATPAVAAPAAPAVPPLIAP